METSSFTLGSQDEWHLMPGRSFAIRYPDGTFEIDASGQHPPPAVGDTIRRKGKLWRVVTSNASDQSRFAFELADTPHE